MRHLGCLPAAGEGRLDSRPSPEDHALHREFAVAVDGALATLPAGQRAAVRLFYLEGLSTEEVAGALGTTGGAVRARLHKARFHCDDSFRPTRRFHP